MVNRYQGNRLRKGRYSEAGRLYHVTTVTRHRYPWFEDTERARVMCRTLLWSDWSGMTSTRCFVVMPDHFHWLFSLEADDPLSIILNRVKGRSGYLVRRPLWQRGFHDHALRHEEDVKEIARYIVANPLRAGLVRSLRNYPYWNAIWL